MVQSIYSKRYYVLNREIIVLVASWISATRYASVDRIGKLELELQANNRLEWRL